MLLDQQRERQNARLLMQLHLREEQERLQKKQGQSSGLMDYERFRKAIQAPRQKKSAANENDLSMQPIMPLDAAATEGSENAVVPLPLYADNADTRSGMLQRIRDRMAQTRGRLAAGGSFFARNVANPYKTFPALSTKLENVNVDMEDVPDPRYSLPQARPRYV